MAKVFISQDEQCQTWLSSFVSLYKNTIDSVVLFLKYKNIQEIHPSIVAMKNLTSIDLRCNHIKEIPEELCLMTQLKRLYLDDNLISSEGIPDNFSNLTKLTHLSLAIRIKHIPECIYDLISLETLSLSNNEGGIKFSDSLSKLTNLKELNLGDTRLNSFPIQIFHLSSLITLNLKNNSISVIPEEISRLTSLDSLNLQNNQISDFHPLKPLKTLRNLFLSENNNNTKNYIMLNIRSFFQSLEED
eukprot:TRINITY_DN567_c0_g5_i2.p1 TRINITY_DN567_c0_g5~~TRINITY_DN567_c0_g5_i2.p1  ORF type:complete len:245 (-),score=34.26 TRINITY_DN567_c0_g5_i2:35-769(-)